MPHNLLSKMKTPAWRRALAGGLAAALIWQSSPLCAQSMRVQSERGAPQGNGVSAAAVTGVSFTPTQLKLEANAFNLSAQNTLGSAPQPEVQAALKATLTDVPAAFKPVVTSNSTVRRTVPTISGRAGILEHAASLLTTVSGPEAAADPQKIITDLSGADLPETVWRHALAQGFAQAQERELLDVAASALTDDPPRLEKPIPAEAAPQAQIPQSRIDNTARGLLGSVLTSELWLDVGAMVIPFVIKSISDSFMAMAAIGAGSVGALAVGGILGGRAVDRLGIRTVYLTGLVVRAAAAAALVAFYSCGALGLPVVAGLFALDYFFTGANRVAEAATPTALYGGLIGPVNRFGAWKQRIIESVGIVSPFLVGQLVLAFGFTPALAFFAGLLGVGAIIAAFTVRPPRVARSAASGGLRAALKYTLHHPVIMRSAAAYGLVFAINLWFYLLVGQSFSIAATATPEAAASVMGKFIGLFCAGGFVGTWLSEKLSRRAGVRLAADPEAYRSAFLRSTRRWSLAAAVSLLAAWAFCLPGVLPAYLAIFPLGVILGATLVQSETVIKTEAPEHLRGTILGLVSSASYAAAALGFFPLGELFAYFSVPVAGVLRPALSAFISLGGLATALCLVLLGVFGRTAPAAAKPAATATSVVATK